MGGNGTLSYEDIYGAGSLDTLPINEVGSTQQKANPNNSDVTGLVRKDQSGIWHISGNLFGQPLMVWFGMLILLVGIKYLAEKGA